MSTELSTDVDIDFRVIECWLYRAVSTCIEALTNRDRSVQFHLAEVANICTHGLWTTAFGHSQPGSLFR